MYSIEARDLNGDKSDFLFHAKHGKNSAQVLSKDFRLKEGSQFDSPYPCKIMKPSGEVIKDVSFPKNFYHSCYRPRIKKCPRCEEQYVKDHPSTRHCKPCAKEKRKVYRTLWIREKRSKLPTVLCREKTCSILVKTYTDTRKVSGFCKSCSAIRALKIRLFREVTVL